MKRAIDCKPQQNIATRFLVRQFILWHLLLSSGIRTVFWCLARQFIISQCKPRINELTSLILKAPGKKDSEDIHRLNNSKNALR